MANKGGLVQRVVEPIEALERVAVEMKIEAGVKLREAREAAALSLRDVAEQVDVTAQAISLVEHGKTLRTSMLRKLATFYDAA